MKIKLCGLSRIEEIEKVNDLQVNYIGFVFAPKSSRYVSPSQAKKLKESLDPKIQAVGVFVREDPKVVASLLEEGIIDIAQLHGGESEDYIASLRALTKAPLIQAFRIDTADDVQRAKESSADFILLDSGAGGTGTCFDWELIGGIDRPYFLAGGLDAEKIGEIPDWMKPYAVDVSSGIETNHRKDLTKMEAFVQAVRNRKEY